MKRALPVLILLIAVCGCATPAKDGSALAGRYTMTKGGFNEVLSIDLESDGSYALDHELIGCVIGPNGDIAITHNREEGIWRFENGVVVLQPSARTKDFPDEPVFVPALGRRLIPKTSMFDRLLVSADYPEHFILKKTKKPNKSPEPTPRLGSSVAFLASETQ
jgi:hypothetical protein